MDITVGTLYESEVLKAQVIVENPYNFMQSK